MGTSASENIAIQISSVYDGTGTNEARKDLGALATAGKNATGALADASKVNVAIGAFEAMGKKIDTTNANAIAGYRAQGDALAANLVKLGATDAEINAIATAIQKVERSAGQSLLDPKSPQTQQLTKMPTQARTAANALGILGQAAVTGSGSMAGLATAVGNVATGLSSLSNSAKIAAGATAIGALVTVAGAAIGGFEAWRHKTKELANELKSLQSTGRGIADTIAGRDLDAKIEQMQQAAIEQKNRIEDVGLFEKALGLVTDSRTQARAAQVAQVNENLSKSVALLKEQKKNEEEARAAEQQRLATTGRATLQLEQQRAQAEAQSIAFFRVRRTGDQEVLNSYLAQYGAAKSAFALQQEQIRVEQDQRDAEIRQQFVRRSDSGAIIALTDEEIRRRAVLLDQSRQLAVAAGLQVEAERSRAQIGLALQNAGLSEDPATRFQGRLLQIEQERAEQIKAIGDVTSVQENAELKKRALYRDTARQASADAKTLFEAFRSSSDKTLKAIGTFGESLRRIAIGAEAARAAVRAAVEAGEAIASAARGDLAGAGLHTAAALQLGAAAALGFRESLGGGGGGGASGGGGGAPTFTPRDSAGGGAVTVNLYTVDPFNGENIRKVSYYLQRNGTLKVPVYPTTGLVGAVA